jgi:hypothetical protein
MKNAGIFVIILIILGGVTGFILYRRGIIFRREPETTPSPPANNNNIPSDWRTYENELGYRIKMPPNILVDTNVGEGSIHLIPDVDSGEFGPANFIYISVIDRKNIKNDHRVYNYNYEQFLELMKLNIGQEKSIIPKQNRVQGYNEWFIYERLENVIINGLEARVFINRKPWEFPLGVAELRYVIPQDQTIYILGGYYGGDVSYATITRSDLRKILSTFRII